MISIVIPVYNNVHALEANLPAFTACLQQHAVTFEIVVVDDGSNNPQGVITFTKQQHLQCIRLPKNSGKGAAIKTGVLASKGDIILFTDADIPFEFDNYLTIIKQLQSFLAPIVIGDRDLASSDYFAQTSLMRRMGSKLFTAFVGRLVNNQLYDTQCGLKGFEASVGKALFSKMRIKGFAFDVELLYLASLNRFRVERVPVHMRNNEQSTVRILKHGIEMIAELMLIKWYQLSGKYSR